MPAKTAQVHQHIIHNDEPVYDPKHDHFGQKGLVETIASTLGYRASPPFVASLCGDWGQGKTSILEAVYKEYAGVRPGESCNQKPQTNYTAVRVIWFEAWRYQHDPTPIVALLNEIRKQLENMSRLASFKKKAGKLTEVAARTILENDLGVTSSLQLISSATGQILPFAGIGGVGAAVKQTGEAWEARNHAYALPSQTLRELLNKAISDILKVIVGNKKNRRLIIIIDDLDRCQPIVAYKLLEGLKIFLNLDSCTFLIGSNRKETHRALKVGIREESGGAPEDDIQELARDYFEKLCSYCWDLPFPTRKQSAEYIDHLLDNPNSPVPPELRKILVKIIYESDYRLLPGNPRRLKSFANIVSQITQTGNVRNSGELAPEEPVIILSLAYVFAFLPDVQRRILSDPSSFKTLHLNSQSPPSERETDSDSADQLATRAADPMSKVVISNNRLHSLAPEVSNIFRMAPVLATLEGIPDKLIHKYLPHATK